MNRYSGSFVQIMKKKTMEKKEKEECCDWRTQDECPIHSKDVCSFCERMFIPRNIKDCGHHRKIRTWDYEVRAEI